MYITISPQVVSGDYSQSATDFVAYLEKENQGLEQDQAEPFFSQFENDVERETVIREIDNNTAKLKKVEPKFYAITVNPSRRELEHIQNSSEQLKRYTRELMKEYVQCFNREIGGRAIRVEDLTYFAKVEKQRFFKGSDQQVRENQPYATKILQLKDEIYKIKTGERHGNLKELQLKIQKLEKEAPHQQNGQRIVRGMLKEGPQSHVHIIMSRKDASNTVSLSPGSKYKTSEVMMNGKLVKRGFDRNEFFKNSEKSFDKLFGYPRNYVETYAARKTLQKDPKLYYLTIKSLSASQKKIAFQILRETQIPLLPSIPTNKVQLAIKTFNSLKKGIGIALRSGEIER